MHLIAILTVVLIGGLLRQPVTAANSVFEFSIDEASEPPGQKMDVLERENVHLTCRFPPKLMIADPLVPPTLYWIRTNRKGHDNAAIGGTAFHENYSVDHYPEKGIYDLRITNATYNRDNGIFECRVKQGRTGKELHSKSIMLTVLLPPSQPIIIPRTPTATEGSIFNLTCSSLGGSPSPQIHWFSGKSSQTLMAQLVRGRNKDEATRSILSVMPTKSMDGSSFRCTVWNRALGQRQTLEASTTINVNYFPRVSVGPDNPLQVEAGQTAPLSCSVDSKPPVSSVKWTRNGRYFDTNFRHTIGRVVLSDAGSYICSADNGLGQVGKAELKLEVLHPPIITLPSSREVNEGDNVKVICKISAKPRPSSIKWLRENDDSFVQDGPVLKLHSVTAFHDGQYICSVTNELRPSSNNGHHQRNTFVRTTNATIKINVRHKPGVTYITPDHPIAISEMSLTLSCGAKPVGYPLPKYRWWKATASETVIAIGSEFTLGPLTLASAGRYYCQAINDLGSGTVASVDLEVFQKPKIITHLQPTIMKQSGDLNFHVTCSANAKPIPDVRWYKNGKEIIDKESDAYQISTTANQDVSTSTIVAAAYDVQSTLKFIGPERIGAKQLMPNDRGHYTCQFENKVAQVETTMFLRIQHAPVIAHSYNKVAYDVGESATIACKMQAFPIPRFEWSYKNSVIQSKKYSYETNTTSLDKDIYMGILHIKSINRSSYGNYICKGINSIGEKRTIIKLQAKGKPDRPENLYVVNTTFSTITLGWIEGFDGGYLNMFTVQYHRCDHRESPMYVDCRHYVPCNITNLEQMTQYCVKVKAGNIRGESKYSEEISITTQVDVERIPRPENVIFEKSTRTATFGVGGDTTEQHNSRLVLVGMIELETGDGSWKHYNEVFMPKNTNYAQLRVSDPVLNLRVRLCLQHNRALCGPYSEATSVEVRPNTTKTTATVLLGLPWIIGMAILFIVILLFVLLLVIKCCFCKKPKMLQNMKPEEVIQSNRQPPPYTSFSLDDKGMGANIESNESNAKPNYFLPPPQTNGYGSLAPPHSTQLMENNSNSTSGINGGGSSVNSQDSLWNVKKCGLGSEYNIQSKTLSNGGYGYDQMPHGGGQWTGIEQPEGYSNQTAHYSFSDEYFDERTKQFARGPNNGTEQRLSCEYSTYGDISGLPNPYVEGYPSIPSTVSPMSFKPNCEEFHQVHPISYTDSEHTNSSVSRGKRIIREIIV